MPKPIILAHRGSSAYAPENTMDAFALAIEQGADGIELDVHLTADGQVVVCHDDTIHRMSEGSGVVEELTYAQLRQHNFSTGLPGYDTPTYAPLLSEVLTLFEPTEMIINIEIKSSPTSYPQLEEKTVALVLASSMASRILYSSFNHDSMVYVKSIDPAAQVALLYAERLTRAWEYAHMIGCDALHPHFRSISQEMVSASQAAGVDVNVWTVDGPEDITTMINMGVHGIITNKPDVALDLRAK